MLLNDMQIAYLARHQKMIEPFSEESSDGVISYGLSSFGYDARLSQEYRIFTNTYNALVDPKNFDEKAYVEHNGDFCIIPPNSFILSRTLEYFRIPDDIMVVCVGKSTYARIGLIVNVTPLEPEWEGHVTLEISNTTPLPAKVYSNEGICQFLFFRGVRPKNTYQDKKGKYQRQTGITLPRIKTNISELVPKDAA